MSRPQARARGNFAQDTLTAEFTTGQIVIMACAALAVACAMFGLGVLVGRYDPTAAPAPAIAAAEADAPAETAAAPAVATAKAQPEAAKPLEITQTESPPPSPAAAAATPATATEDKPEEPAKPEVQPAEEAKETVVASATPATGTLSDTVRPRITRVEPLPINPGSNRIRVEPLPAAEDAARVEEPAKPAGDAKPADSKNPPAKVSVSEMDDSAELMEPMPEPEKVAAKPAAPATEAEKKPVTAAPASKPSGKYAIQLASFKGSAGKSKAEDYAKRVSKTTGQSAEVSTTDNVFRVVIAGFTDKAAATAACNKIKQSAEFKDAFVKAL